MFKIITIPVIGKVTIDLENISKCKSCRQTIFWGVSDKPQYVPLDLNNGKYIRHRCKPIKYDDRLKELQKQEQREKW